MTAYVIGAAYAVAGFAIAYLVGLKHGARKGYAQGLAAGRTLPEKRREVR